MSIRQLRIEMPICYFIKENNSLIINLKELIVYL